MELSEQGKKFLAQNKLKSDFNKAPTNFNHLIQVLFEIYSHKLDCIIKKVNSSKSVNQAPPEQIILEQLFDFKTSLKGACDNLVNDIWENFQFYARQSKLPKKHTRET